MRTITKTILTLVAILFVGACTTTRIAGSVVGEYQHKLKPFGFYWLRVLENGVVGTPPPIEVVGKRKWKMVDNELHIIGKFGTQVLRVNNDSSITDIAHIDKDGKRTDLSKDKQITYEKFR